MKIAEVRVSGCRCETVRLEPIPRGIVGAVVAVEYTDPAWDSLRKTVVFRGAATKDVLDAGNEIVIPAEVVSKAGGSLYMGVYGVDAENHVAIPTIWTELGVIQGAATPSGDASTAPSLPVWAQIQAMVGDLGTLDTEAKSNLVAAINEALTKGGEIAPAEVQRIVEDYLKANPPGTGASGKDGITPTIGKNGNWYLGSTDTGKPSRGADGTPGAAGASGKDGSPGADGKGGRMARSPIFRSARSQPFRQAAMRQPAWAARQKIRCSILVSRGVRTGRAAAPAARIFPSALRRPRWGRR
ncbi:MAG: hypothetical protein BHW31_04860 [Firmicutes bacterium CAG:110_56_8]|nr:MAG: hypothetical protein BHW31_04860 [Firmicutes bacterium CAG:110_56_8]